MSDRLIRMFDGPANLLVYETVATPPANDGVQGDWALCLGGGTLAVYGPKTNETTWPTTPLKLPA